MSRRASAIGLAMMLALALAAPAMARAEHATLIDVHAISVARAKPVSDTAAQTAPAIRPRAAPARISRAA